MRGIKVGFSACYIAEIIALILTLYFGWGLNVLVPILVCIVLAFTVGIIGLFIWANKEDGEENK